MGFRPVRMQAGGGPMGFRGEGGDYDEGERILNQLKGEYSGPVTQNDIQWRGLGGQGYTPQFIEFAKSKGYEVAMGDRWDAPQYLRPISVLEPIPDRLPLAPPTPIAPTPIAPTPIAPTPIAPTPIAPTPIAPTPIAPRRDFPDTTQPSIGGSPPASFSSTQPTADIPTIFGSGGAGAIGGGALPAINSLKDLATRGSTDLNSALYGSGSSSVPLMRDGGPMGFRPVRMQTGGDARNANTEIYLRLQKALALSPAELNNFLYENTGALKAMADENPARAAQLADAMEQSGFEGFMRNLMQGADQEIIPQIPILPPGTGDYEMREDPNIVTTPAAADAYYGGGIPGPSFVPTGDQTAPDFQVPTPVPQEHSSIRRLRELGAERIPEESSTPPTRAILPPYEGDYTVFSEAEGNAPWPPLADAYFGGGVPGPSFVPLAGLGQTAPDYVGAAGGYEGWEKFAGGGDVGRSMRHGGLMSLRRR
jgi:hypothetical protein